MSQTPEKPSLEQLLANMERQAGFAPDVQIALGKLVPEAVFEHAANKQFAFSTPALPANTKHLLAIAVSAAIGSERCTESYVRAARTQGVGRDEIMAALLIARFVKATTVVATSMPAMERLLAED